MQETKRHRPIRFWYAGNIGSALEAAMNAIGVGRRETYDAYAAGWAERRALCKAAYQGEAPIAGSTRRIVIAKTDDEARAIAERAWPAHVRNFTATSLRVGGRAGPAMTAADDGQSTPERAGVAYGSKMRDLLGAALERLGPNHTYFAPAFQWGDMTHTEARTSMELFVSDVMPAL